MNDQNMRTVHPNAMIGKKVRVWFGAQIADGAEVGDNSIIGANVYIDRGVKIGKKCKIQTGASIFRGVTIEDCVFIGPHVCFTNDKYPRAFSQSGAIAKTNDWKILKTIVRQGSSIGAGSIILPGVTIGKFAMIGAGAVVTRDVPDFSLVVGNPAKIIGSVRKDGKIKKLI
jgi:UDP-2-acetamido-3-amino-2,3-dideoxy-glucuronate N-acetyltransferase